MDVDIVLKLPLIIFPKDSTKRSDLYVWKHILGLVINE